MDCATKRAAKKWAVKFSLYIFPSAMRGYAYALPINYQERECTNAPIVHIAVIASVSTNLNIANYSFAIS